MGGWCGWSGRSVGVGCCGRALCGGSGGVEEALMLWVLERTGGDRCGLEEQLLLRCYPVVLWDGG